MKKSCSVLLVSIAIVITFGACTNDQCITCTYTDPATNILITEPEVCGSKSILDTKEAGARQTAEFYQATDFACVRK